MIIWISLAVFIVFLYLAMGRLNTAEKRKRYLIVAGLAISTVMALRGDHGGHMYDYRVYVSSFELIARTEWTSIFDVTTFEQGFVVMCKLLSYISKHGQTLIVFQSFFCIYAVCRFIYKNTEHVFETLFFFVTLGTMGFMLTGIRQSIAIGFILFSIECIKKRKFVSFLLLTLLATSIHLTAIVFILPYIFINSKIFSKHKHFMALTMIVVFFFANWLIDTAANILYGKEWNTSDPVFSLNGIINVLIYGISAIYQFNSQKKNSSITKTTNFTLSIVGVFVYFMRYIVLTLERISLYFTLPLLSGLSEIYADIRRKDKGDLFCFFIVLICFVLYLRRMGNADYGNYQFFWN